jgi:hypothetical protein
MEGEEGMARRNEDGCRIEVDVKVDSTTAKAIVKSLMIGSITAVGLIGLGWLLVNGYITWEQAIEAVKAGAGLFKG